MLSEAREFGASMRRERERRGITLDEIAAQTKVSASVLGGLEHGDLARWPTGIFRRAFVRAYASAVGLDVEDTLKEFLRVFPEDGSAPRPRPAAGSGGHAMRLALGDRPNRRLDGRRLVGAALDVVVVMAGAGAGWLVGGAGLACWAGLGAGVLWHATGVLLWGTSPGVRLTWHRPPPSRPDVARVPAEERPDKPEPARAPAVISIVNPPRGRSGRRERRMARGDRPAPGPEPRVRG